MVSDYFHTTVAKSGDYTYMGYPCPSPRCNYELASLDLPCNVLEIQKESLSVSSDLEADSLSTTPLWPAKHLKTIQFH